MGCSYHSQSSSVLVTSGSSSSARSLSSLRSIRPGGTGSRVSRCRAAAWESSAASFRPWRWAWASGWGDSTASQVWVKVSPLPHSEARQTHRTCQPCDSSHRRSYICRARSHICHRRSFCHHRRNHMDPSCSNSLHSTLEADTPYIYQH